jgi:hypothetical protein
MIFEDSKAPFWMIKKNGYYKVGSKNFIHKTLALTGASRAKQNVLWEFNSDVFSKCDWQTPIQSSILELYKLRAQQLRNKYDHLILAYSGGPDSDGVLDSFLINNIHLDEIVIQWPEKLTKGKFIVSNNRDATNILSEYELTAKPKLEYVKKNFPRTKITFLDMDTLDDEYSEDMFTLANDSVDYIALKRQRQIHAVSSAYINKGVNVAIIYGFDKPTFNMVDGYFCALFLDRRIQVVSDLGDGKERNVEFFYWSPDLPEISIKQAQIFYEYFKANPKYIDYLTRKNNGVFEHRTTYEEGNQIRDLISMLVYPTWDMNKFQVHKSRNVIISEHYAFFRTNIFGNNRWQESHTSALKNQLFAIDARFFERGRSSTFIPFTSGSYRIGKLEQTNDQ